MGSQAAVSFLTNLARAAIGLGATSAVLSSSLYTVDGGERAVLFDRFRGVLDDTVSEGTHFLIPFLQQPFIFDIRTRPHSFSSVSGTKDLQMVNLTLRVLSRPDVNRLPHIFKTLGLEYDEKVLPSIGNEVLKAVVAQFNADQLLTERPHVSALVRDSLIRRARNFNILLDDVVERGRRRRDRSRPNLYMQSSLMGTFGRGVARSGREREGGREGERVTTGTHLGMGLPDLGEREEEEEVAGSEAWGCRIWRRERRRRSCRV